LIDIYFDNVQFLHTRKVYALFDAFGDFGGIKEVIMLVIGFLMAPISEHSFIVKAISKLYLARTSQPHIFEKRKGKEAKKR